MSNPVWPGSLPQVPLLVGDTRTEPSNVKASTMLSGPPKTRAYSTSAHHNWSVRLVLTDAHLATFQTFYRTTTVSGSLQWEWEFPEDPGTAIVLLFDPKSAPKVRPLVSGQWEVSLDLIYLRDG